jgi:hypothetical protein
MNVMEQVIDVPEVPSQPGLSWLVEPPRHSYELLCPGPPRIAADLDSLGPGLFR